MSQHVLHPANSRGHANHGWLDSWHTFSFSSYYHPSRMGFGVLRVLNDDTVQGGMGFDTHPHSNMEIISIPLEGDLEHRDSMGNVTVIRNGDIQVMSAGTGITHSEYNKNPDRQVKFLQIWIFPNQQNVVPRYGQITLNISDRQNKFQQILSPNAEDEGVWIYQDAWFHMGRFDEKYQSAYTLKKSGNGIYCFVLQGTFTINGIEVNKRDGIGFIETAELQIQSNAADAELLIMEIPMK